MTRKPSGEQSPPRTPRNVKALAAARKASGAGGRGASDDSEYIKIVGMLLAKDESEGQHPTSGQPPYTALTSTDAIRRVLEESYSKSGDTNVDLKIGQDIRRILPKLRRQEKNGKTALDNAIEQARRQNNIHGGPINTTILTHPFSPAAEADAVLIQEFINAVDDLQDIARGLARQRYTILHNDMRADLKAFLATFKKLLAEPTRKT